MTAARGVTTRMPESLPSMRDQHQGHHGKNADCGKVDGCNGNHLGRRYDSGKIAGDDPRYPEGEGKGCRGDLAGNDLLAVPNASLVHLASQEIALRMVRRDVVDHQEDMEHLMRNHRLDVQYRACKVDRERPVRLRDSQSP